MSLRFHYKCDEASGDLVDLIGGVPLVASGSPSYGVAGQFGDAVKANSNNQFVGNDARLNLGDGSADWTVVLWLMRAAGNGGILTKTGAETDLVIDYNGSFGGLRVSYGSLATAVGIPAVGAWASLSVKYVAADLKCYARLNNGTAVEIARVTPGPFGDDSLTLGTGNSLWGFDEVGGYDHALSDAELTALMTAVPDRIKRPKVLAGQSYSPGWRAGQRVG